MRLNRQLLPGELWAVLIFPHLADKVTAHRRRVDGGFVVSMDDYRGCIEFFAPDDIRYKSITEGRLGDSFENPNDWKDPLRYVEDGVPLASLVLIDEVIEAGD